MTINHDDSEIKHAFDVQLAAERSGVLLSTPPLIRSAEDREMLVGLLGAADRVPSPATQLAERVTFDEHGKPTLPADASAESITAAMGPTDMATRAKLIALLRHRTKQRSAP